MPQATAEETLHRKKTLSRERVLVGVLTLAFLAAGLWFAKCEACWISDEFQIRSTDMFRQSEFAKDRTVFSPLTTAIVSRLPVDGEVMDESGACASRSNNGIWATRLIFVMAAALLGLSLCFVTRKFFGRRAGLRSFALYVSSPMLVSAMVARPMALAAWGAYGVIFTAIATAHTLYAPREVILWNWKRILLLAFSITLAVGAMPMLAILLIPAYGFLLWAAPHRKRAATAIMGCGVGIAAILLSVACLSLPGSYWSMALQLGWLQAPSLSMYWPKWLFNHPSFGILIVWMALWIAPSLGGLALFCSWRRPRFFGNAAPLLVALLLTVGALFVRMPGLDNYSLLLCAMPFWLTFTVGVEADVHERHPSSWSSALIPLVVLGQCCELFFLWIGSNLGLA